MILALGVYSFLTPSSPALAQRRVAQDKGDPTKQSAPPVEEPTKAPPPDEHMQPEKTAMPLPGHEPTKVPTLDEVTKTPTWSPTDVPTRAPSETPAPTLSLTPATVPTRTPPSNVTSTPDIIHVNGVVFGDMNGNGRREPGEPGLPNVRVVVEDGDQRETSLTDAEGRYSASASPSAIVSVVPPMGWMASLSIPLPATQASDFPMLREVEPVTPASSPAQVDVTKAVYDFSILALAVAALGATILIAMERLRRSLVAQFNSWALTNIQISRESLNVTRQTRSVLDDPLQFLSQAALDATGEGVRLIAILEVLATPYPAIVTMADDQRRFIFSPISPEVAWQRENRHSIARVWDNHIDKARSYPLDALNSTLFVADDLGSLFVAELKKRTNSEQRSLPRVQRWYVYVIKAPVVYPVNRKNCLRARSLRRWMLRR